MASSSLQVPYLTVVGALAVATVFFFMIAQPLFGAINETKEQLESEKALLEERRAFRQSLDRRLAELNANAVHEERLKVLLPAEEQVEDELRIIHQRATAAGLTIVSVSNVSDAARSQLNSQKARGGESTISSTIVPLAFSVDVRGTYQGIRAFLTALERSPRLSDIEYLRLSTDQPGSDQMQGRVTVYFYMVGN